MNDVSLIPFEPRGGLNTTEARILEQVAINIARPLPQAQPHEERDAGVILAAGGPSLTAGLEDLRARRAAGAKLVAVNGSHDWLVERGLIPSAMVLLDARPGNVRFVQRPVAGCRYLIASQSHPAVFEALAGHDVTIFHADLASEALEEMLDRHYFGRYHLILGGSTVTIRALMLLRMLGYRRFDIYGFDACVLDGRHHAYEQPENDGERPHRVTVAVSRAGTRIVDDGDLSTLGPEVFATREFYAAPWMAVQAREFCELTRACGHLFDLTIHGDGMIAWIVEQGARAQIAKDAA